MDISLYNDTVFQQYKSNSQIARVLTEGWCEKEMYCPNCLNDSIAKMKNNNKATDFVCNKCRSKFELKSASKCFSSKVVDGEYNTMIKAIESDISPNFFLMHYSNDEWVVKNLFMIPNFFVSESIIEARKPLSESARRAGWTGCNILLKRIPDDGKIQIIKNETIIDFEKVHNRIDKMNFLRLQKPNFRGWTADVLKCVRDIDKKEFSLSDVYRFQNHLKELHPDNSHIEAKIRQQLQILRDNGVIDFVSSGKYRIIDKY